MKSGTTEELGSVLGKSSDASGSDDPLASVSFRSAVTDSGGTVNVKVNSFTVARGHDVPTASVPFCFTEDLPVNSNVAREEVIKAVRRAHEGANSDQSCRQ